MPVARISVDQTYRLTTPYSKVKYSIVNNYYTNLFMDGDMNTQAELQHIQSLLFKQISSAASKRDVSKVAELSGLAKECERIETELTSLNSRVEAVKSALNDPRSPSTTFAKFFDSLEEDTPSSRKIGKQARSEWIAGLPHGISLNRHGKQYQTARGQSVAVAFSNEIPDNRWFLDLPEEPPEVAVLLCNKRVKFNVKKDAHRFLLFITGKKPLDVTGYIGNYDPLR